MTYDDLGRQDTVTDTRGITSYAYDVNGRMTQIATPEGTVNYEYDEVTGDHRGLSLVLRIQGNM